MDKFNVICPDRYPMKCNLPPTERDTLLTEEKYKGFFMLQYDKQDEWLDTTMENYFNKRSWRLFNAGKEAGTGTKWCKVCRFALAADFGVASLTPLNNNVFQEIGLMQGLGKPVLYLLNPNPKAKLPFDIDDKINIQHTGEKSLMEGLSKEIPLFIEKVRLSSGYETSQRESIREKLENLTPDAIEALKRLLFEGDREFQKEPRHELVGWINQLGLHPNAISQLEDRGFLYTQIKPVGPRQNMEFHRLNEPCRRYLEELLWE